ncbi:MAG: CotH kinase family protein [Lentimicrobium sp.]|nr:CotH kinase family protein [Lentimicrobium sp.]
MINSGIIRKVLILFFITIFVKNYCFSQTNDTITNWDGITENWIVWAGSHEVVENPYPDEINASGHCMKVVTSTEPYDLMLLDMNEAANFNSFPRYNISVYAPSSGGNVVLKFENSNNTSSKELLLTPTPGQWSRLEFNFAGLAFENYTRMVIFPDITGTTAGNEWFIDDIVKLEVEPLQFSSNLPIVVIDTYGAAIVDEPKIPGFMGVIDNGPGVINNFSDPFNHYNGHIGIEIRGQSSQMFPKKSYSMVTRTASGDNLNVPLLGMPSENDWVLYAPYTDKSMLRNVVTFELGRKMSTYCTRTRFCEVVINNDYKGIYVLMERIKRDNNRVNIASLDPNEISGENLTGGYILRVDKMDPGFSYLTDGWLSTVTPSYPAAQQSTFQYFYPKANKIVPQQREYIKNYVTGFENSLTSSGFRDAEHGYQKFMDVPSFIDFMLLSEISKEVDKYKFSTYFYKEKNSDGGKLFAGPAWDFNLGYGNVDYWPAGLNTSGWLYSMVTSGNPAMMYWWKRLMEDDYFRDLAKTRWVHLRETSLTNSFVQQAIDSLILEIDEAKVRNYERWPILGQYVWPNYDWQNNTYDDEVEYFSTFLFNRLSWMDANMPGNLIEAWAGIYATANKISFTLFGDYFRRPKLDKSQFKLNDAPAYVSIQGVEYVSPSQCMLTLSSDAAAHGNLSVTVLGEAINTLTEVESNKIATIGINEQITEKQNITVHESNGSITLINTSDRIESGTAEIINLSGQVCGRFILQNQTVITFSHSLKPGIYYLMLRYGGYVYVRRVVILF